MGSQIEQLKNRAKEYAKAYHEKEVKRSVHKGEMEEILRQADWLMEQKFCFCDRWDMEPCSTVYEVSPFSWDACSNGDPEWIYMLNRQEYLKKMLMAYWYTGQERYVEGMKQYILHWVRQNTKETFGSLMTRTIDTGIRCASWTPLLLHLLAKEHIKEEELFEILESMEQQFLYLYQSYVPKYRQSNWGVLQTTSILQNAAWFGECFCLEEMKRIAEWAKDELLYQLESQIYGDGSHWEQSMMYHIEVLNSVTTMLVFRKRAGVETSKRIEEILYGMYDYVMHAAGPDHFQIAQGDSDVTDIRDVMTRGAMLFEESAFKYAGYEEPDLESIWCFGMEQKEQYLKLKSKQPETLNGLYTDSGNFYYRSGWEIDSNYTYLHNGPLGSSHGHSELTHICNYYKGKAFLTDSGRYSYIEGELRNRLKSPEAHNVSVIKGCPMGVPDGSWSYAYFADSLNNYCKTIEGIHYAEMPYVMQNKQKEPAYCCRRILIFPEGIWLLSDDLRMAGTQESTMYFHLAPEVIVKEQKEREVLLENEDVRLILGAEYPLEQRQEILSRIYNENEEHTVFQAKTNWENEGVCTAWMHPENAELKDTVIIQAEGKQVATSVVAKEVWISGELSYVVIMRTHENYRGRKVFLYQNCGFYGKVVILKKTEEGFEVLRFRA